MQEEKKNDVNTVEKNETTSNDSFKNDYIKSGKLRYEHRIVTLLKDKVPNTEQGTKAAVADRKSVV